MPLATEEIELIGKRIDEAVRKIGERLDRTDTRLDSMSDSVRLLAEKLTRHDCRLDRIEERETRLNDYEARLRQLEESGLRNSVVSAGVVRFAGWLVAGAIGLAFWIMKGGGH